jgi:copper transport protein
VTLILANPAAGIEPVRRNASAAGAASWRVEGLRVPVAGLWIIRVDLLISDFEKIVLEERAELPRLP